MSVVSTKTTDYSSIVVSLAFPVMGLLMSFVSVWHIRNETKRLENAKDKYDDEQREKPNKNSDNGTPAESDANPNDVKDFGDKKKFYCIFSNKKRKTYKCNNDEKEKKYGEGCDYNDGAGKCNFIIENENYEFRMSRLVEIGFMLLSLLAFMIGFWLIGTYYGKITLTDISLLIPIVCSIVVYASSFLLFYKCKSFSRLILGQVRYREFNAHHRDYWNKKGWSLFWIIIASGPLAFIILFVIKIMSA
jgi:hypothetical protein